MIEALVVSAVPPRDDERESAQILFLVKRNMQPEASATGVLSDPWHCVRAGCIHQDIPGPTACRGCVNWQG